VAPVGVLSRLGLIIVMLVVLGLTPAASQGPSRDQYRGRVIEAGSGHPVDAAGVFLVWPSAEPSGTSAYREAQTDAQGLFSIDATTIKQERLQPPQLWVYKPGYQLYPDRDVRPAGAAATPLTQPAATIRLIGARTDAERIEALNDFVAAINRHAPTAGPILLGLIESEFTRLKQSQPDAVASTPPPSAPGAPGPCDVDPRNPPSLPPPRPPRVPEPGTSNPYEGRRAPYYGRVVDAQTGASLVGAVVVASWPRRVAFPFGAHSEFYDACEVVTDDSGRFVLDGRAIEARGRIHNIEPPRLSVFYPGYSTFPLRKVTSGDSFIRGDREGFHDVTIGLVRLTTRTARVDALRSATPDLLPPPEKTPRLKQLMEREYFDLGFRRNR
jgi:hypothetical protein